MAETPQATIQKFPGGDTSFWVIGTLDYEKTERLPMNPVLNQRHQTVSCHIITGSDPKKDFLVLRTGLSFDPEDLPEEGALARFDGIVRSTVSQQERVFTNLYITEVTPMRSSGAWAWEGMKTEGEGGSKLSRFKEAAPYVAPVSGNNKVGNLAERISEAKAKTDELRSKSRPNKKKPDLIIKDEAVGTDDAAF